MTFSGANNASSIEPISIFRAQSNLGTPPLEDSAATGNSSLDSAQVAAVLGEPVPIIFCRRLNDIGGVFVSPKATEARYANNAITNLLTVNLELVLSEGDLPLLQIRDVFQRACRVGTWAQAYDARAGNWNPGNVTTVVSGKTPWNCPVYCGTSGSYEDITTLSYTNTFEDADENWSKQVHAFVRQGLQVTRVLDSAYGSSNNFVDLVLYLLDKTKRVPDTLIDSAAMLTAASFTNTNGFFFNGVLQDSQNLEDWLYDTSVGFLLRFSERNGKKILKPRLPINANYTIKTTAITPVFSFTEDHIIPDSFEIDYIPLAERIPTCIIVLWRQQPDDDIGIIRNTEIRFTGEAANGPYEQYDLSAYCTSENHAVKIGTYYLARRKYITHNLRISVAPDAYNSTLEIGDIVRVKLRRETDAAEISLHDFFYEVERINKNTSGIVDLDLTHFPIDAQNQSLIALKVSEAVGAGYTMPTGRSNFDCDISGRRTDTTTIDELVDPDPPVIPDPDNFEYNAPLAVITTDTTPITVGESTVPGSRNEIINSIGGSSPTGAVNNPEDPVEEEPPEITGASGDNGQPVENDTLEVQPTCPDAKVTWFRTKCDGTGSPEKLKEEIVTNGNPSTYQVTADDVDYFIYSDTSCADAASPSGYGAPTTSTSLCVTPDFCSYGYVRWEGTITTPSSTTTFVSGWKTLDCNAGDYYTIGPMAGCANIPTYIEESSAFYGPPIGPVAWRASVTAEQRIGCTGGTLSLGGLGQNGNEGICTIGNKQPVIGFGCFNSPTYPVKWEIKGFWQFANLVDGEYVLGAGWNGVEGFSEYSG